MPPIRSASARSRKPPPPGFSDLEDTLLSFSNKMKDAQMSSHEGKKRHETTWPIMQISHQRSRYIYELYYGRRGQQRTNYSGGNDNGDADEATNGLAISKELYDYLLKNGYADAALIAKWKKHGYEKLCCLRCVQTKETNFSSTCICRVPKATLDRAENDGLRPEDEVDDSGSRARNGAGETAAKAIQCVNCGCRGCASAD